MELVNVFDYEALARTYLDAGTWAYFAGGSNAEITLQANRRVFERVQLRPRMLVDVSTINVSTNVLGVPVKMPILIAPMGFQDLAHLEGECATARALGPAGTVMVVSTFASRTLEAIAQAATGPLWFQLSVSVRRSPVAVQLIQHATTAGYQAIVLTVDSPRSGTKEEAQRLGFHLPSHTMNVEDEYTIRDSPPLTWESLPWLRSLTPLPLILKGILTAEDARLAVEHHIDGLIVSNHGGRQLDTVPSTLEVLPEIVEAVDGRCEIYMDGGIRRGTDVLKALALGACGVFIGRPVLWGLTVDGTNGVMRVLEMVRAELELAMALVGCPTLANMNRSFIHINMLTR
jgi:isopentenyl diphosphate isomerase/L-lactate dehydrogenase-like FMN-dependent dehydrogenase